MDEKPFTVAGAWLGQLVSLTILAKLVDRQIISPADAADLLDDVLLQLEEMQASFPEDGTAFEFARDLLSTSQDNYRAMLRAQNDSSP
jgi:hypothetical protein